MEETKGEIVEILSVHPNDEIKIYVKWIISKFSSLTEEIWSPIISSPKCANTKWKLKLKPHLFKVDPEDVAIYLHLHSTDRANENAKFSFSLMTSSFIKTNSKNSTEVNVFKQGGDGWGFFNFIKRELLINSSDSLLPNDQLTVCCDVVFKTNHQLLHISSNLYQCDLVKDFNKLFDDKTMSDVSLTADGKVIKAHKLILATRSPVFAAMFSNDWAEQKKNLVEIDDMDYQTLNLMLQFIYSGSIANLNVTKELLAAANKYGIDSLKEFCEQRLGVDLAIETVCDMFIDADRLNAEKLKGFAKNFINANASAVIKTDGWKELCKSHAQLVVEIFNEYFNETLCLESK